MKIGMFGVPFLILALCGCQGLTPSGRQNAWVTEQGGLVVTPAHLADMAADLSRPWPGLVKKTHVLNSDSALAFSWPSGDVYLCRGLCERATDDQVAAVIAHEMGHLLAKEGPTRNPTGIAALAGIPGDDTELRADILGIDALRRAGRDPRAMTGALALVRSLHPSRFSRKELTRRISYLEQLVQ